MQDAIFHRQRAQEHDTGAAVPCIVTRVDLSGEPMVSVKPMQARRERGLDGKLNDLPPMDIDDVPYLYPSSDRFAIFLPPAIGMQGFLISTATEIGEAGSGIAQIARQKEASSGFFVPSGVLKGAPFRGSADWAEMRSRSCRVAISDDAVHLQSGEVDFVIDGGAFDLIAGGVSLVAALKEMSAHIRLLEVLVHPNGMPHTGPHPRLVDQFLAALAPSRSEKGVR